MYTASSKAKLEAAATVAASLVLAAAPPAAVAVTTRSCGLEKPGSVRRKGFEIFFPERTLDDSHAQKLSRRGLPGLAG